MKKLLFLASMFFAIPFAFASSANAAREVCFILYDGVEKCVVIDERADLRIDKKVSQKDGDYRDNIRVTDHVFKAEDTVYFRLVIKNGGEVDLENVIVKDNLPHFIAFNRVIDGPEAKVNGREVTFDLGRLDAGKERTIKFTGRVAKESELPRDDKLCLTNVANVTGKRVDNSGELSNGDYAKFCIALPEVKAVEAPTELPEAGAGASIVGLVLAGVGMVMRKRLG